MNKIEQAVNNEMQYVKDMTSEMENLLYEVQTYSNDLELAIATAKTGKEIVDAFEPLAKTMDIFQKKFKEADSSLTRLGKSLDPVLKKLDGK